MMVTRLDPGENTEKYITFSVPIEKEGEKFLNIEKKPQKLCHTK